MNEASSEGSDTVRTVVVLGAGGYLGSVLCQFFHALPRHRVVAVSRGKLNHSFFHRHVTADVFADDWAAQVITDPPVVLINCAFDFKGIESRSRPDKFASFERNIGAVAASASARLINISSMSAFEGCRTDYGREKMLVEAQFNRFGGVNIRPGLIASWRRPGAAFQNLIAIATGSKIVPVLAARGSGFYCCDLEAVVLGIYALAGMKLNKPHTLSFCYRERIKLGSVLRLIESRHGARSIKVPVPWQIAFAMLRLKEALIGRSKVRADSVLDFAYPNPRPAGRGYFAAIVARFRGDLGNLSGAKATSGNFYFLEGQGFLESSDRGGTRKPLSADVVRALGRLADA
jgi:nucleoside-diphosphate-sugar epimerase